MRPNSDGSVAWTPQGAANHWENVDDAVFQPAAPNLTDYQYSASSVQDDLYMTDPGVGCSTKLRYWIHAKSYGAGDVLYVDIHVGGGWQGFQVAATDVFDGWFYSDFLGAWNAGELAAAEIRYEHANINGEQIRVHCAYLELDP